jgi:hypothetical protein
LKSYIGRVVERCGELDIEKRARDIFLGEEGEELSWRDNFLANEYACAKNVANEACTIVSYGLICGEEVGCCSSI